MRATTSPQSNRMRSFFDMTDHHHDRVAESHQPFAPQRVAWGLEFGASLEFGAWCLGLGAFTPTNPPIHQLAAPKSDEGGSTNPPIHQSTSPSLHSVHQNFETS